MVARPTTFRQSSINSRDISCPQAYHVGEGMDLQDAASTSLASEQSFVSTSTTDHGAMKRQPASYKPGVWLYMAFATLGILTIMVALDATALSVALPIIAQKLKGTGLEAFWAATSYLLTSTVFQPTLAAFSNAFGRKWVTTFAVVLFLLGILMSGVAQNFTLLLAGRTIQGIGGGGIIVLTQVIICDLVPLRLRGQWFGVISGMYAIGSVSGPLLGGVFSEKVTWRWIFWVNLPFVGMGLVMIPLFIRLGVAKSSLGKKLAKIDWIGSVVFIASMTGFLIPLSWGGVAYPWTSWRTIAPMCASAGGLVLLYFYEERVALNPIIRTSIFKNRNAAAAYVCVVIHGMVVVGSLYYLPLYYEAVKGLSPILSGVALFPETFTVAPGAFIVGTVISKTGHYRWAVWSGWSITTLGLGLLYLLDVNTSTVEWIFLNLVVGVGLGFNYSALGVTLQAATSEEDMTSAVAMFTFFRLLGQALGVVIGGVIFQNQIKSRLSVIPELASLADQYSADGSGLAALIRILPESPTKQPLVQAYADSCKIIWVVFCAIAGMALLCSLVINENSLDRKFVSPQQQGTDGDHVALMEEKAEQGTAELAAPHDKPRESSDEKQKSSLWYGAKAPKERRVTFRGSELAGQSADRRRPSPWPRASTVPEENRTSSEYSVPIELDDPEKSLSHPPEGTEEELQEEQPPQYVSRVERPASTLQLPSMGYQPTLAELMHEPFEFVMGRRGNRNSGTRNSGVRHSGIRNAGVRGSWAEGGRRSRAESFPETTSRPTSWAPVYGMG